MNKSEQELTKVLFCVRTAEFVCKELDLDASLAKVKRISDIIDLGNGIALDLLARIRDLRETMEDQLQSRKLLYVPQARAAFYDQPDLFGADVQTKFSKASFNIKEAGNCLALNRSTAAVFHLMSALEVPLDSLASALGLAYSVKNWDTILRDIETVIGSLGPASGPNWKADKEFYSTAAIEFRFFKDAWRNHTMHARAKYDWDEGKLIFEHVKAFIVHLSTRLQERQ